MTKEFLWVPVLNHQDQYTPGKYLKEDIYKGENALPNFTTKEECALWCQNNLISLQVENLPLENISLEWWLTLSNNEKVALGAKHNKNSLDLTLNTIIFEYNYAAKYKVSNLTTTEIITEIIELESLVTEAIFKGHKANNQDQYAQKRKRLVFLREILRDKNVIVNL